LSLLFFLSFVFFIFFFRTLFTFPCYVLLMHISRFFIDIAVEYRNNEKCKECTADETAYNYSPLRCNHLSTFTKTDCQRQHPKRCRKCCNNNWTETVLDTELKIYDFRYYFFFLLIRIVNKQYGVVDHYTEEHNDTDE